MLWLSIITTKQQLLASATYLPTFVN